jgi:hypothetical protein
MHGVRSGAPANRLRPPHPRLRLNRSDYRRKSGQGMSEGNGPHPPWEIGAEARLALPARPHYHTQIVLTRYWTQFRRRASM